MAQRPDVTPRTGSGELPAWLAWAREIEALCQTGLAFSTGYDATRYRRLMEIAAEITAAHTGLAAPTLAENFMAQPGYATPKVDVRAAVVRDGRILLVQERSDGMWCMPGGWADVGEYPAAMVAREALEESGIVVVPRKVVGVFDANRTGRPLEFYHAYKVVFLCDHAGGELRGSSETHAAAYFEFSGLPPLSTNRTHPRHLAEVQAHLADPLRPAAFE